MNDTPIRCAKCSHCRPESFWVKHHAPKSIHGIVSIGPPTPIHLSHDQVIYAQCAKNDRYCKYADAECTKNNWYQEITADPIQPGLDITEYVMPAIILHGAALFGAVAFIAGDVNPLSWNVGLRILLVALWPATITLGLWLAPRGVFYIDPRH